LKAAPVFGDAAFLNRDPATGACEIPFLHSLQETLGLPAASRPRDGVPVDLPPYEQRRGAEARPVPLEWLLDGCRLARLIGYEVAMPVAQGGEAPDHSAYPTGDAPWTESHTS
jgi:hypothetical protein